MPVGGTIKEIDYVYLPDGEVAVVEKEGSARTFRYAHTDHLGSFRTITDASGNTVARYTYSAWGIRSLKSGTDFGYRGYTGHEHLDEFGLINMNARLYDPLLGRFLGIDPYVSTPGFAQGFNRYSYCLNNPLIYTDPSGEYIFTVLSAFFAPYLLPAAISLDMAWMQGGFSARSNGGNFWQGAAKGFGIGLACVGASYLTPGIGNVLGHTLGHAGTELARAAAHGLVSGGLNRLQGGSFWQGFGVGSISSLAGSGMSKLGMPSGALPIAMGGVGALTSWGLGGDPLSGFMQGYNIGAFNHTGEDYCYNGGVLQEVVVTATRNSSWEYWIPGWGASLLATQAWNDGRYIDYVNWTLIGSMELISLGTLALETHAYKAAFKGTAKVGVQYSDDLVKAAQKLYPNKAGATELHHIAPKYLGGAGNGALVPLDGAYHQMITNEFRAIHPYGLGPVDDAWRSRIMKDVYSKYPLPPVK